jgi:hypothetical protein
MPFQTLSRRLNFFFPPNSWALLINDQEGGDHSGIVQKAQTICRHWGSRLVFPFELDPDALQESEEARRYWLQKLPGLRYLHERKKEILLSDLATGFNTIEAGKLIQKKLNLPVDQWGHLLHFGGSGKSYSWSFQSKPDSSDIVIPIKELYDQFGPTLQEPIDSGLSEIELQSLRQFEELYNLPSNVASILELFAKNSSNKAFASINRECRREPACMVLDYRNCRLNFHELGISIRLAPLPLAIYWLYINHENGFANADRFAYQTEAETLYKRIKQTDDWEQARTRVVACFVGDDKAFRDAVSNANKTIKHHLQALPSLVKQYLIAGPIGGIKKIPIRRELVTFKDW